MKKQLLLFVFAVVLYFFGLYTLIRKIEPFYYYFYITSWWSYIIFLDALLSLKYKRFFVLNRYLPLLIIISCGYWCFFELLNIRLQNWFYINLPPEMPYRYPGYLLGFGTVCRLSISPGKLPRASSEKYVLNLFMYRIIQHTR